VLKARTGEDDGSEEGCVLGVALELGTCNGIGMLCLTLDSSLEETSLGFSPGGFKRQSILMSSSHPNSHLLASDIPQNRLLVNLSTSYIHTHLFLN